MIYLEKSKDAQSLFVPRHREVDGELMLTLKSSVNLTSYSAETIDLDTSALYHRISVTLENAQSGEYEYTLSDGNGVLSTGLLVIREERNVIEYNNEIYYEQYAE